jgi:hypothetical protein
MSAGSRAVVAATPVVVAACGFSDEKRRSTLRAQAAFDFKCSADSLTISELTKNGDFGRVSSAGVEGCRQRKSYTWDGTHGAWILNVVEGQTPAGTDTVQNDHAKKEANQ